MEQFFVNRLLADLGYGDDMIRPKASLPQERITVGRSRRVYRPDYVLSVRGRARWICEAKAPGEDPAQWTSQAASYGLMLRRTEDAPVEYTMVTNGVTTIVSKWDGSGELLRLSFQDFVNGNGKYQTLRELLDPSSFTDSGTGAPSTAMLTIRRRTANEINADFAWCHRQIHRRENLGYSPAFMELVKLIFLKLLSDREVHRLHPVAGAPPAEGVEVPISDVRFSVPWIEARERDTANPMNAIQFADLVRRLEDEIAQGEKKRIFTPGEQLRLSNETIKEIARRLQGSDLFAIDADLNGRLFETFLNATLRGKDLGQYFTPRSVVKLGVRLAGLRVDASHQDTVLDACCGTGGFLIDALAEMWTKVDKLSSLSATKRTEVAHTIARNHVIGVDIAVDPALARIARINMYLHGDGGSSIYQVDALDKSMPGTDRDSIEMAAERREFASLVSGDGFADVVLTNPPFAKTYKRARAGGQPTVEDRVLDEYDLAVDYSGDTAKPLKSLRSSVMFLERYHDLLKPGGRIVTVIDDSVLGNETYKYVRDWLRSHYIIEAVVSLPGDAFQRSQARVKTSLLVMRKRDEVDEEQPDVFMTYAVSVGVDDPPRERVLPGDSQVRAAAALEIDTIGTLFEQFQTQGTTDRTEPWIVSAATIADRMDVKSCLLRAGEQVPVWQEAGLDVVPLSDLLEPRFVGDNDAEDVIDTGDPEATATGLVRHMRARYDGVAESGDEIDPADSGYAKLFRVHEGDLVISHINAIHGAVAVVPAELDGHVVTTEYTVTRAKADLDVRVIWALMRTPVVRADMLTVSTGIGRTRIRWDGISSLRVPRPTARLARQVIAHLQEAENSRRAADARLQAAVSAVGSNLLMTPPEAETVIAAFKPPR